jgi:glycosyltransferase involved in cell wall biosynthesis
MGVTQQISLVYKDTVLDKQIQIYRLHYSYLRMCLKYDKEFTVDKSKYNILYLHNTPEQIDVQKNLSNSFWKQFHKIVFVSYWQMEEYVREYKIPYSQCIVIPLTISPIEKENKIQNKITLIYHPTPHRGLEILVNVFNKLCKEYDNLTLKVFSSFKIYGWHEVQKQYEQSELYQKLNQNPNIQNIGFVSNEKLRKELSKSHIFAYPCIWKETFCLSLLEAMSAGLLCIHPNYGCLPETASNWTMMYDYHENKEVHEKIFYEHLKKAIDSVNQKEVQRKLKYQSQYVNHFYNWETRTQEWIDLLKSLEHLSPKIPKNISFSYS